MKKLQIIILHFIIGIFFITSFTSCKKNFPDGPDLSLNSIESHIQAVWGVYSIKVDNIDSTDAFKNRIGCYLDLTELIYYHYNISKKVPILDINKTEIKYTHASYIVNNDNDNVYFSMGGTYTDGPSFFPFGPFGPDNDFRGARWQILRLTDDELWMNLTYQGESTFGLHTYFLTLKK